MPLTDLAIRKARSNGRTVRLYDGRGLYLEISPSGGKWWRFKYRIGGREKRLSLGTYPDVGLHEARERLATARRQLASGVDPSAARRAERAARVAQTSETFEAVAREWFARQRSRWSEGHADRILAQLERNLFPWLGRRPVGELTAPELLTALNRLVERGAVESAHRLLQNCVRILRYAAATGRLERNVAADLHGALPPVKEEHRAAITEPREVGALLRAIDAYHGSFVTRCALRLAILLFVRPGELRNAEWTEFDLDDATWNIPAEKMKMRVAHLVPLSRQAVAILRELHALTGSGRYVFPSARSSRRPMSNNAVLSALRRMGFEKDQMSGHGFRAMARTILDEVLHFRPDYIEHQLAHAVRDPNGRAYNRTAHLPERRQMMQEWADYLDGLAQNR